MEKFDSAMDGNFEALSGGVALMAADSGRPTTRVEHHIHISIYNIYILPDTRTVSIQYAYTVQVCTVHTESSQQSSPHTNKEDQL